MFGTEGKIDLTLSCGPAPEPALGLRPRIALSSAQVSRSVSKLSNAPPTGGVKIRKNR